MSERKRAADKQAGRGQDDSDEEFVTEPQIASSDVMATRRIVSVKRPEAPAAAAAAPSPFGSVLGSFGAATKAVAPSPFASFGAASTAPPAALPAPTGFGFGLPAGGAAAAPPKFGFGFGGAAPAAAAPATEAKPAEAKPAATGGFGFSFGGAAAGGFNFGEAVNSFATAKKAMESAQPAAAAASESANPDDGEEDPEKEVPIASSAAASSLPAAEVTTGEEGETTAAEAQAKLFELSKEDKQWHERGAGTIKVNFKVDANGVQHSRVVMRDGKMKKGLLNCLLDPSFRFGQKSEKHFTFTAPNDGIQTFLVKVTGAQSVEDTKKFFEACDKYAKK